MPERDDNPIIPRDLRTEAGFEHFVRETQNDLLHFILRKGIPVTEAEDLAQESYLTLWKRRADARNPRAFLLGIANTLVCAHRRAVCNLNFVELSDHTPELPQSEPTAGQPDAVTLRDRLSSAGLGKLTRALRDVLELVWLKGYTRPEAAAALGITQSALRVREKRALDALRESTHKHVARPDQSQASSDSTKM